MMVCRCGGVSLWCVVVCRCGVSLWCVVVVCRGVSLWCVVVACCCGVLLWRALFLLGEVCLLPAYSCTVLRRYCESLTDCMTANTCNQAQ